LWRDGPFRNPVFATRLEPYGHCGKQTTIATLREKCGAKGSGDGDGDITRRVARTGMGISHSSEEGGGRGQRGVRGHGPGTGRTLRERRGGCEVCGMKWPSWIWRAGIQQNAERGALFFDGHLFRVFIADICVPKKRCQVSRGSNRRSESTQWSRSLKPCRRHFGMQLRRVAYTSQHPPPSPIAHCLGTQPSTRPHSPHRERRAEGGAKAVEPPQLTCQRRTHTARRDRREAHPN